MIPASELPFMFNLLNSSSIFKFSSPFSILFLKLSKAACSPVAKDALDNSFIVLSNIDFFESLILSSIDNNSKRLVSSCF